jgi:protein SCO1/2
VAGEVMNWPSMPLEASRAMKVDADLRAASGFARDCRPPGLAFRLEGVRGFFTGAGLPVFVIAAVMLYEAFLLAILFLPASDGAWGGFAREFKQWCFNYDPRTGGMSWAAAWVMLAEPLFIAGIALVLWRRALAALGNIAAALRHWRAALAGAGGALLVAGSLFAYGRPGAEADAILPFPGERIRTALEPPAFRFTDQQGQAFSLEELRGQAVLVTGVYALCSTTCPEILVEIRTLLDTLPGENRERLRVVALTLNPEYETTEVMQALAAGYGFKHPEFRYLNGEAAAMHDVVSRLGFAPYRDPVTRVINHANLFLLLDADGRIAYRLTLDPRHRPWLREAVLALTAEAAGS